MEQFTSETFSKMAGSMGMGKLDDSQLKQAENIWKMLDDLSENNPESYKSFIKNNMQNGMEEMKKEKEKKETSMKVDAKPQFLLKMQATLQTLKLNKEAEESNPLYEKLKVTKNPNIEKFAEVKKKLDKEVKIYVNVLSSSRVRKPLSLSGKEVADIKAMETWKVIPYSVQDPVQRKSESLGNMVYFYEFIVNDEVGQLMGGSPVLTEQLITFVLDKIGSCLKEHRNPLLKLYDFQEAGEILYYQITKMSIVRHKSKKYKTADKKKTTPSPILLEPEADRDCDLEKAKAQLAANQMQKEGGVANIPEAPINEISELKQRQERDANQQAQLNQESVLDGLRIVKKDEKEKAAKQKKVMIQEVTEVLPKKIVEIQDKQQQQQPKVEQPKKIEKSAQEIVEESLEKPNYIMRELSESVYIEITLSKAESISDLLLDISPQMIKLQVPLLYKLEIPLPPNVSADQLPPKWNKKTKTLKLTLPKLN